MGATWARLRPSFCLALQQAVDAQAQKQREMAKNHSRHVPKRRLKLSIPSCSCLAIARQLYEL
ncbi:unnamed protein product [Effrenium voratum]|nr:unnamed protein product [Effrenium voratum]